jgi:hypothetical protein
MTTSSAEEALPVLPIAQRHRVTTHLLKRTLMPRQLISRG